MIGLDSGEGAVSVLYIAEGGDSGEGAVSVLYIAEGGDTGRRVEGVGSLTPLNNLFG